MSTPTSDGQFDTARLDIPRSRSLRASKTPVMIGRRGGLLVRAPAFTSLLSARALSLVGDGVCNLALIVHVQRTSGTGIAVGLLLLVASLPALLSPVTGVFSDRMDQRRLLASCEIVQGLLVVVVLWWLPALPVLLVLLFCKATAATIADPAARSAIPALVADADLVAANSLLGGLRQTADILGPLLGGVLVATVGIRGALGGDAASFLVGTLLVARLPPLRPTPPGRREETSVLAEAWAGLRYVASHPIARAAAIGFFLIGLSAADDVALPFLAHDLGGGVIGIGALYAAGATGMVLGYVLLVRVGESGSVTRGFVAGAAIAGIGNSLTGLAPAIGLAVGFQVIRGLGTAVLDTSLQTMLQRSVARPMLGRVFANVYGAVGIAAAISVTLGGVLLDATSPGTVLVIAGLTAITAGITSGLLLRVQERAARGLE
jgi:MFS family permease